MLTQTLKAIRLTLAIIISLYIAMRFSMKTPDWAVTSALIVSNGTIGEIQAKWWQRIIGHLLGGIAGFFMIWWLAEDPISIMLAACLFGSLCTYISLTHFIYKDMWRWILIGFVIVFSASLSSPDKAFGVLLDRVGCVFIGSSVIFLLSALWPIDYIASIQNQYFNLLDLLCDLLKKDNDDAVNTFLGFTQKISAFRMSLSSNYSDYRAIYPKDVNVINRIYALEKLGRHLYSLKTQHALTDEVKDWILQSLEAVRTRTVLPTISYDQRGRYGSLITLIEADFAELTEGNTATRELSLLRWQWQNRMFSAGTDSALTSSTLFFITCLASLLLWRYGWPSGGAVMLLTAVLLIACQYGERMSPRNYIVGFSVGTAYAFPLFIFLLPNLHNADAFWLGLILIYFPLAFVMYGSYKSKSTPFLAFAIAVIVNANSQNYVPSDGYFNSFITFVLVLAAVICISSAALSLLVINDTETRLKTQIEGWVQERRRFLTDRTYNRTKILARLERRTDVIISMYSKLDANQQEKWKKKVSSIPLMLTRIQRWGEIKRELATVKNSQH